MWNDIETTTDYLHFSVISKTISEVIIESGEEPISIGVSGSWGAGKSSMVKMIGKNLMDTSSKENDYVFIEFNAWLYQGYDDAKNALLQVVTKKLADEIKERKPSKEVGKKFTRFLKRVNWFQVAKMTIPVAAGLIPGISSFGAITALVNAVNGALNPAEDMETKDKSLEEAFGDLTPELKELLNAKEVQSTTRQIEELRKEFEDILSELKIKLVVLVDDLDRCLPETSVATLEAMRLLLFVKRTAFIIAADEQMIRNGVRAHFGSVELTDGLVTSYFDKLIQVPITVPRLGVPEVKVFTTMLFLELMCKKGNITKEVLPQIQQYYEELLSKAWNTEISKETLLEKYSEDDRTKMRDYVSIADQIAGILVSADAIKGNPRLIKRLLNAWEIRNKIARLNGMTLDPGVLIKMLLFERCASTGAFDYLSKEVSKSDDGRPSFIKSLEDSLANLEEYKAPDTSWNSDFIKSWILLEPRLSDRDLRPLLYLSRDKSLSYAAYDGLSDEGNAVLAALKQIKNATIVKDLVTQIQNIGERQSELILNHFISLGKNNQWDNPILFACIHVVEAIPETGNYLAAALDEIPASAVKAPMIPIVSKYQWAQELLHKWQNDPDIDKAVKNAISQIKK